MLSSEQAIPESSIVPLRLETSSHGCIPEQYGNYYYKQANPLSPGNFMVYSAGYMVPLADSEEARVINNRLLKSGNKVFYGYNHLYDLQPNENLIYLADEFFKVDIGKRVFRGIYQLPVDYDSFEYLGLNMYRDSFGYYYSYGFKIDDTEDFNYLGKGYYTKNASLYFVSREIANEIDVESVNINNDHDIPIVSIGAIYYYERTTMIVPPVGTPRRVDSISDIDPGYVNYWTDGTYVYYRSIRLGFLDDFEYLGNGWSQILNEVYYNGGINSAVSTNSLEIKNEYFAFDDDSLFFYGNEVNFPEGVSFSKDRIRFMEGQLAVVDNLAFFNDRNPIELAPQNNSNSYSCFGNSYLFDGNIIYEDDGVQVAGDLENINYLGLLPGDRISRHNLLLFDSQNIYKARYSSSALQFQTINKANDFKLLSSHFYINNDAISSMYISSDASVELNSREILDFNDDILILSGGNYLRYSNLTEYESPANQLRRISDSYIMIGNSTYYGGFLRAEIDGSSFKEYWGGMASDIDSYFYFGRPYEIATPGRFIMHDSQIITHGGDFFIGRYQEGPKYPSTDIERIVNNYFRIGNQVHYIDYGLTEAETLLSENVENFSFLPDSSSYWQNGSQIGIDENTLSGTDANDYELINGQIIDSGGVVYFGTTNIPDAVSGNIQFYQRTDNQQRSSTYWTDGVGVYRNSSLLPNIESSSFELLSASYWQDNTHLGYNSNILEATNTTGARIFGDGALAVTSSDAYFYGNRVNGANLNANEFIFFTYENAFLGERNSWYYHDGSNLFYRTSLMSGVDFINFQAITSSTGRVADICYDRDSVVTCPEP